MFGIGVDHCTQNTRFRPALMRVFQRELRARLVNRRATLVHEVERRGDAGPVCAGFAVDQHGLFSLLHDAQKLEVGIAFIKNIGIHIVSNQRHAIVATGFDLE